jgi:hypothetical protein
MIDASALGPTGSSSRHVASLRPCIGEEDSERGSEVGRSARVNRRCVELIEKLPRAGFPGYPHVPPARSALAFDDAHRLDGTKIEERATPDVHRVFVNWC